MWMIKRKNDDNNNNNINDDDDGVYYIHETLIKPIIWVSITKTLQHKQCQSQIKRL